ncbi:response regulator [Nitrosopumilus sp. b1]|uniref:response regulator n=1 Tax=Nitrosopumilus sp. b1 TaxID=2109907 RepID=UPI0015F3BA01|nr:response regulator [Nitrosopumilus sp. b1]KAF6243495.1 response regulator [Nitrosopumilus sp. b1]
MVTQVIIVEDDPDSADILTEYLEMKEIKVVAKAKDGKEAVEYYSKLKPEVVLLDIIMPGYDGFYALERIREIDNNAKVIFVTAATNATTQARLFQVNVDGIIFKPFEIDYLLETINIVKNGGKRIPNSIRAQI